jgi:Flp pilus assembly protein TadD
VKSAQASPNQSVDIEISAYASPDGGYKLNEPLAASRESNTKKYVTDELNKNKVKVPVNAKYTAQDWEGFKQLVEKSNIQDKDLILRVLSMYSDTEQREREIKNISTVYSTLADEILPQLRRARLTANVKTIGKTDAEITSLAASNPNALSVEELLYAATLKSSAAEKATIYKKVIELFPNDARGYNNLGVAEYTQGNIAAADEQFKKAANINSSLPEVNLNLGYVALANGNRAQAEQYISKASGAQGFGNAQGLLAISDGNYAKAEQSFGNTVSNNAALAQILAKDYSKASTTLNAIAKPDATTDYLKAVVGARTNTLNQVTANLKSAVSKDSSFANKAFKDPEFAKYLKDASFLQAIGK